MADAGLALDFLQQIVNVQWGFEPQQGLVAEYRMTQPSIDSTLSEPTAYAIESGEAFSGVNMGASGLGYTVLTKGLVCFGKPRDGPACFMAASDWDIKLSFEKNATIQRGTMNKDGILVWEPAGGGKGLIALTFAGKAFHASYIEEEGGGISRIATSFDGKTWNNAVAFPVQVFGGAVAAVVPDKDRVLYTAAGQSTSTTAGDSEPVYVTNYSSLAWATAQTSGPHGGGLTWEFHGELGIDDNPGAQTGVVGILFNGSCTVAGGWVRGTEAGGKATACFVAATYNKQTVTVQTLGGDVAGFHRWVLQTAAAAHSTDGSSWINTTLPGVLSGSVSISFEGAERSTNNQSMSLAVTYVPKKERAGFFLCTAANIATTTAPNETGTFTRYSTLHKSDDGVGWSTLKTSADDAFYFTLSTIAKDTSKTKIVHL